MSNKIILYLFLVSYLGLSSCGKGTRPTVSYINEIKEETKTHAKDGSYIYTHYLNVDRVSFYNERKLKKIPVLAELRLSHLSGFKKLVENAGEIKYKLFAGDSTETVYTQKDSALMVLVGVSATITDNEGHKVVVVNDYRIPTQNGTPKIKYVTDTTNVNGKCISVSENITLVITSERNTYYKNIKLDILNNPLVFKKEQKYKLYFKVYDKVDPNRYFEGETPFTAY